MKASLSCNIAAVYLRLNAAISHSPRGDLTNKGVNSVQLTNHKHSGWRKLLLWYKKGEYGGTSV